MLILASPPLSASLPRDLRLWQGRFERLLLQVTQRLARSARSFELTEAGTVAAALCDKDGAAIAEAGASPLETGVLSAAVRAVILKPPPSGPGELVAVNDPFVTAGAGGTDLGSLTLVAPVRGADGEALFYLALRGSYPVPPGAVLTSLAAGGHVPALPQPSPDEASDSDELTSLPPAVGPRYRGFQGGQTPPAPPPLLPQTLDEEGARVPPTEVTDALFSELAGAAADPGERLGDLRAHRSALHFGVAELQALLAAHPPGAVQAAAAGLYAATAALAREAVQKLPSGVYAFADSLDDDGTGLTDVPLRVTLRVAAGRLSLDFSDSADAVPGALNTVPAVVSAAVRAVVRMLLPADAPTGDGLLAAVELRVRPGSVLGAQLPSAVGAGFAETALRVVDVVLGALGQVLPRRVPAAGCGTQSGVLLSGAGTLQRLTLGGGSGGSPGEPHAAPAGRSPLGHNRRSLSVELLEQRLPVRVERLALRPDSGGGGLCAGGEGVVRELRILAPLQVTLLGERRRRPPYGLGGGGPGQNGRDELWRDEKRLRLPSKAHFLARPGDVLVTETPGGAGHGDPTKAQFFASLLP